MRDKVVLITGAARGIGASVARRMVHEGARVALVGLEPERLESLTNELGAAAAWWCADVTNQEALNTAVSAAVAHFGRLDVVITNAGIANLGTVAVADIEAMARVINVNVIGTMRTVKAALPHLIASKGYLLIVSSAAAFCPMPGMSAQLPYPFSLVTSVDDCSATFVAGCRARRRRVFVPKTLGVISALRQLLGSATMQRAILPKLAPMMANAEMETQQLGRSFGEHSVGMGDGSPPS